MSPKERIAYMQMENFPDDKPVLSSKNAATNHPLLIAPLPGKWRNLRGSVFRARTKRWLVIEMTKSVFPLWPWQRNQSSQPKHTANSSGVVFFFFFF